MILWNLASVVAAGALAAEHCNVFDENLVYTFYGLPRYKDARLRPGTQLASRPVCLIFKHGLISSAWKTFPFDTGAHEKHFYDDHIPTFIERSLFEIDGPGGDAGKAVSAFFTTNMRYCLGTVGPKPVNHLVADALWSLYSATGAVNFDQRAAAIEVIFNSAVDLATHLEAVIVPLTWKLQDPQPPLFTEISTSYGAEVLTYIDVPFGEPSDYRGAMAQAAYDYAKKQGYL